MTINWRSAVGAAALLVFSIASGYDHNICTPGATTGTTGSTRLKPTLPKTFQVVIECNMLDKNITFGAREYYDGPNNRGTVVETQNGQDIWAYFNYNISELLYVIPSQNNFCQVGDLKSAKQNFLFGYTVVHGMARIFSTAAALRFGGTQSEQFVGTSRLDGRNVDQWHSCIYSPQSRATISINWYFSTVTWLNAFMFMSVPVRLHIVGSIGLASGTGVRRIEHIYEFSQFREKLPDPTLVFETPPGTYCKGRKVTKSIPIPPSTFSLSLEKLTPVLKELSIINEIYDFTANLTRYDISAQTMAATGQPQKDALTVIHDYNAGISYVIDKVLGNCSLSPLTTKARDATGTDLHHPRLKNIQQFYESSITSYVYEGTRTVRGITCDVWISKRTDWPNAAAKINSTFEYYFATKDWVVRSGMQVEFGIPVMLKIKIIGGPGHVGGLSYDFNIYNYVEGPPPINSFDITPCYKNQNGKIVLQYFQFDIPGTFKSLIMQNVNSFRYAIVSNIAAATGIAPIRIQQLQFDYTNPHTMAVSFALLERPVITFNPIKAETITLNQAISKLRKLIEANKFTLSILSKTTTTIKVLPYTFKNIINNSVVSGGYGRGDMAAVGVVLSVAGLIIGVLITYGVYHRGGGSFKPERMN